MTFRNEHQHGQNILAARILIDPAFSDGYESNQSGEGGGHSLVEADIQSPIDLTSRTPTHIRFAELEQNQLMEHPAADRLNRDSESNSNQRITIRISEMRRVSPAGEILNHQSGGEAKLRMDSSGPIAQEETPRTAPIDLSSQQIVEKTSIRWIPEMRHQL